MNAFVHFAVGVSFGLLILGVVDSSNQREFLLIFASGVWGMLPDGHWMLREFGWTAVAASWKQVHRSSVANLFWFHWYIDRLETGQPKLETGIAVGLMSIMVLYYYSVNEWHDTEY